METAEFLKLIQNGLPERRGEAKKVLIAGEHTSLTHAWIQGAIESGLRAAVEVNARE